MKSVVIVFGSILNNTPVVQIRLHGRLVAEPPKEARLKTSHNYFFVKKKTRPRSGPFISPSSVLIICISFLVMQNCTWNTIKKCPRGRGGLFSTFTGESRPRSPGANNPNWDVSMTGFGHLFASFNKGFQHINKLKSELGLGE